MINRHRLRQLALWAWAMSWACVMWGWVGTPSGTQASGSISRLWAPVQVSLRVGGLNAVIAFCVGTLLGLTAGRVASREPSTTSRLGVSLALAALVPPVLTVPLALGLWRHTPWPYGWLPVLTACGLLNIPWVALQVFAARIEMPSEQIDLARVCGMSSWQRGVWLELRWVLRSALEASAQVFAFSLQSFYLVSLLGGGPPLETLESFLMFSIRGNGPEGPDWTAARWALVLQAAIGASALGVARWVSPTSRRKPGKRPSGLNPLRQNSRQFNSLILGSMVGWPWVAYFGFAVVTGWPQRVPAQSAPLSAWQDSVWIGSWTALGVGIWAAALVNVAPTWARFIQASVAISPLGVAIGLDGALGGWIPRGWPLALVSQILILLPWVLITFQRMHDLRDDRGIELARVMGAPPFLAWRWVEGRRWVFRTATVIGLVVVVAALEGPVAIFFSDAQWRPLAVWISDAHAQFKFADVEAWHLWVVGTMIALTVTIGALGQAARWKRGGNWRRGHGRGTK